MGLERGGHCLRHGGKGDLEGIADDLVDDPALGSDGVSQEGVVAGIGPLHGLAVRLPQTGGTGNIGEQKGDGARWQRRRVPSFSLDSPRAYFQLPVDHGQEEPARQPEARRLGRVALAQVTWSTGVVPLSTATVAALSA